MVANNEEFDSCSFPLVAGGQGRQPIEPKDLASQETAEGVWGVVLGGISGVVVTLLIVLFREWLLSIVIGAAVVLVMTLAIYAATEARKR